MTLINLSYQRRTLPANSLSRSRKLDTHIKLTSDMNEIHQLHAILREGGGLQPWHVEMADSIPLPWTKLLAAFAGSQGRSYEQASLDSCHPWPARMLVAKMVTKVSWFVSLAKSASRQVIEQLLYQNRPAETQFPPFHHHRLRQTQVARCV